MTAPELYADAGSALLNLGRWLQRAFPRVNRRGSQGGEDEVIAKYFQGQTAPIIYVDVGASHPIENSNTWELYLRGARGLLIEPLPQCWHALMRHRPGDYVCPVASSNVDGYARLRVCHSLSSIRPDWSIEEQGTLYVETERLSTTLARYPAIRDTARLCSIDVEGHERQVLEGIDWATFRPEMFVIEYRKFEPTELGTDESAAWADIFRREQYRLLSTTDLNQIWVRK